MEPSGKKEDGEQEQGIAMGLHSLKEFLVERRTTQQCPSQKREQPKTTEKIHGFGGVTSQKLHRDQVQENLHGAEHSVFGVTETTRMMADRDFRHPGSSPTGKDGNESMHLTVEANVPHQVPPIALQGTAVIMEMDATDPTDQSIGQPGGKDPSQPGVLPVSSPAADHIVTFLQLLHDKGNILRIILKIRVQGNNDLPVGVVESGGNGSGLPKVADKLQDPHPRIQPSQALELLGAPIGASIIDEEDFAAGFPGVKA